MSGNSFEWHRPGPAILLFAAVVRLFQQTSPSPSSAPTRGPNHLRFPSRRAIPPDWVHLRLPAGSCSSRATSGRECAGPTGVSSLFSCRVSRVTVSEGRKEVTCFKDKFRNRRSVLAARPGVMRTARVCVGGGASVGLLRDERVRDDFATVLGAYEHQEGPAYDDQPQ